MNECRLPVNLVRSVFCLSLPAWMSTYVYVSDCVCVFMIIFVHVSVCLCFNQSLCLSTYYSMRTKDHQRNAHVSFYQIGIGGKDESTSKRWKIRTLSSLVAQFNDSKASLHCSNNN